MPEDDRYAALRLKIMACAEARIAAFGLDGLRARDIAAAAGCALGTLYNVFADIDDIVLAVNARTLDRLGERLAAKAAQQTDPAHLIVDFGTVYLDFAADEWSLWQALFTHRMSGARDVPADYVARYDALFRMLERPIAVLLGAARADDAHALARTLFSAVHGIAMLGLQRKIDTHEHVATAARLDGFLRVFLAGLGANMHVGSGT